MNSPSPIEIALNRCDEHIAWYAASSRHMRLCHYASQVGVIVLTAAVPLLALLSGETFIKDSTSRVALVFKSTVLQAGLADWPRSSSACRICFSGTKSGSPGRLPARSCRASGSGS